MKDKNSEMGTATHSKRQQNSPLNTTKATSDLPLMRSRENEDTRKGPSLPTSCIWRQAWRGLNRFEDAPNKWIHESATPSLNPEFIAQNPDDKDVIVYRSQAAVTTAAHTAPSTFPYIGTDAASTDAAPVMNTDTDEMTDSALSATATASLASTAR
ncbi:hypothetical protein I317_06050 [Kwoniella heveanensis CBS 569]|nr:hypothetical protein I317_06050 [Kwoniella heveanensis CBS 569]